MALLELSITNLAIVDRVRFEPAAGFNVLTGETGAGKSIIVDALALLLGGRAGPGVVRAGAERAVVEGIFEPPAPDADGAGTADLLADLTEPDDPTLILSREVSATGRSVCRVNGRAVPVRTLTEVARCLLDIHGQSEHLSLFRPREQAALLDRFGGLTRLRAEVAAGVRELRALRRRLAALRSDERELARRIDLLTHQSTEIAAAGLTPGEEEELRREHARHANAERLGELALVAHAALTGEAGDGSGAIDLVATVSRSLAALEELDPGLADLTKAAESVGFQLDDLAHGLRSYRDGIDHDPARMAEIDERMLLIRSLQRKYGGTVEEIIEFGERAEAELAECAGAGDRVRDLEEREPGLVASLAELAGRLSASRREAAARLVPAVEAELAELGMAATRMAVRFECVGDPDGLPNRTGAPEAASVDSEGAAEVASPPARVVFDEGGIDRLELWISANPGEPLRPLRSVASGGETSRIMLAIRTVLTEADPVSVLVFDEVDAGVGGRIGSVVGAKLAAIGRRHQVLAVTHLPQIAAFGDRHVHVAKRVEEGRTGTVVTVLDTEARIDEIAAMLGATGESARHTAVDLLAAGRSPADP